MPSVTKSTQWFIRITAPWDHIRSKMIDVRQSIDFVGCMVGYHHGTKAGAPHAHIALRLRSELQKQSVDVRYKKLFGVDRQQYSSKVWDGNTKALSYLYHDPTGQVEDYFGLSEEEIDKIKDLNTEIQKVVVENKKRASNKVVDYVLERIEESKEQWTRHDIADCILRAVAHGQFYEPGDFQLEKYLNEIELKQAAHDKQLLYMAIESRIARLPSFRR